MGEIEDAVDEIYRLLGGKVSRDEIEKSLRALLDMKVNLRAARDSVINKYGGSPRMSAGRYKMIEELTPMDSHVNLRAKVLSINSKEYESDGAVRTMYYGRLGDESGVIPFTAWSLSTALRKGDCVDIKNAYVKEWQGNPKVVIGQNSEITLLPPDSVRVKSVVRPAKVSELHPGMGLVEVVGKVLSVSMREVNTGGETKLLYSGIFADDTGEIPFSSWGREVKEGAVLRISGAYVTTFRGMPQLVFDNRADISEENIDMDVAQAPVSMESLEGKGGYNVLLEGVVIDIKPGSGLIYRCPECNRVVEGTTCPIHGRVTPVPDLRIKAIVDDGTGATMCVFGREQTEAILGMSVEDALKLVQENMGIATVVEELIEEKLIARPIRVRGNVSSDEKYGLRMYVKSFEFPDVEGIAKNAQKILEDIGW